MNGSSHRHPHASSKAAAIHPVGSVASTGQ